MFYPDKPNAYTFWDMRTNKRPSNLGWRIDYFLVSNSLGDLTRNSDILPDIQGSDHCPVTLEIDLDSRKDFETPKSAGNLRPEFVNYEIVIHEIE